MSSASSEPVFAGGGRTRPLTIRRAANARGMRLSVDPRDGTVRLSLPTRAALRPALAWVEERRGWVEGALAALPAPQPIVHGATIPFEGAAVRVEWQAGAPRSPSLSREGLGWVSPVDHFGPDSPTPRPPPLKGRGSSGVLVVGGPLESLAPRVLRWLRSEALARLDAETRAFAQKAGVTVGRVGVGDPRSRWGSCSGSGDIRYSWRLILAPPEVREATVAHEVAHRLHMDHSRAFHAAAARLLGREPVAERRWLRAHGSALYWLGRDS